MRCYYEDTAEDLPPCSRMAVVKDDEMFLLLCKEIQNEVARGDSADMCIIRLSIAVTDCPLNGGLTSNIILTLLLFATWLGYNL